MMSTSEMRKAARNKKFTCKDHINPLRDVLADRYPAAFTPTGKRYTVPKKPLAVGIHTQIMADMPDVDPHLLTATLNNYVNGPTYLNIMVEGQPRVNLDGTFAGIVSQKDQEYSMQRLAYVEEKFKSWAIEREKKRLMRQARKTQFRPSNVDVTTQVAARIAAAPVVRRPTYLTRLLKKVFS